MQNSSNNEDVSSGKYEDADKKANVQEGVVKWKLFEL